MRVALISMGMALALVFAACSDDDTPKADTGVIPDSNMIDTSMSDTAQGDTVGSDAVGSDASSGSCNNAGDKAGVVKSWGGKDLRQLLAAQIACLAKPTPQEKQDCLVTEVKKTTGTDITDACLGCYAGSALCTAGSCLTAPANCATDPNGTECIKCQCTNNCITNFTTCAGIPASVTCP